MERSEEERRGEEESRDWLTAGKKGKRTAVPRRWPAVDDKRGHREASEDPLVLFVAIVSSTSDHFHGATLDARTLEIAGGARRVIGPGLTVRPIDLNFGDVAGNNARLRFLTGP